MNKESQELLALLGDESIREENWSKTKALAEKFAQYFQRIKKQSEGGQTQEIFLQELSFLFPALTDIQDIESHTNELSDYCLGMSALLKNHAAIQVFKGDFSMIASLRAFHRQLFEHLQLIEEQLNKQAEEELQQQREQQVMVIERQRADRYPGYRDFWLACLQLPTDKQIEVKMFLDEIWPIVQKYRQIDEAAAWALLNPLLDELVAIKKGKVGVESLEKIAAFIKGVKTKLFPGASPEQLQAINNFLRESVGAELLQAAYPSQNNVVVVRLWLREADLNPEAPTVAGVQSGGHLAIHIYDNDDKQKYFSFVTTNEVVKEAGVLGRLAKKIMKIPAGNDLKGSLAQLVNELDAVYFQEAGRYVVCKQVLIPLSEADFSGIGLSEKGLNAWADEFERKVQSGEITYNFFGNNCSSIVAEGLKQGGSEKFETLSEIIHTPKSVFEYAEKVASNVERKQQKALQKKRAEIGVEQPHEVAAVLTEEEQKAYFAHVDSGGVLITTKSFLQASQEQTLHEALRMEWFAAPAQEVCKQLRPGFWRNLFFSNPTEKLTVNDIVDLITQTSQDDRFKLMDQLFKKPSFLERMLETFKGEDKAPARFYRAILKQPESFSQLIKTLHAMNDIASISVLDSYAVTDHKLLIAYAEALIALDKTEKNAAYFKNFMDSVQTDSKLEKALACLKEHDNTRSAFLAYKENGGLVSSNSDADLDMDAERTEDTATPVSSDQELSFSSDEEEKKGYEFGRR